MIQNRGAFISFDIIDDGTSTSVDNISDEAGKNVYRNSAEQREVVQALASLFRRP